MAVRIRVYPNMGAGALGMNGYGGAVNASTYYNSKLQSQKQVSNLQLGYERALADERISRVRLEERLKNPYLTGAGIGAYGGLPLGVGLPGLGVPGVGVPLGLPVGGGMPIGGIPAGFGGGQTNITNQTSTGAAAQTVTNSNVNNVSHTMRPIVGHGGWGHPMTPFGGGGFLSGLLGALI
jgi:hypothetical protein